MDKKHIKFIDGFRVIALLSILFYHLIPTYVPCGYLGVAIFFVLSGFLSMNEIVNDNKKRNIKDGICKIFGKIIKLMPLLLLVIFIISGIIVVLYKSFLKSIPNEIYSSIFCFNNVAQILRNESYFEAMNSMKPFTHLWAISIMMQFYALFYIFVYPFYNKKNSRIYTNTFLIITILSILSNIYFVNRTNASIIAYYSLFSRIYAFTVGALISIFLSRDNIKHEYSKFINKNIFIKYIIRFLINLFKILIIAIFMFLIFLHIDNEKISIYVLIIWTLFFVILLKMLYVEHNFMKKDKNIKPSFIYKLLSINITNIIVDRSYIIYLIHYPIIILFNRLIANVKLDLAVYTFISLIIIIVVTEILYRFNDNFIKNKTKIKSVIIFLILIVANICMAHYIEKKWTNSQNAINENVKIEDDKIDDLTEKEMETLEEKIIDKNKIDENRLGENKVGENKVGESKIKESKIEEKKENKIGKISDSENEKIDSEKKIASESDVYISTISNITSELVENEADTSKSLKFPSDYVNTTIDEKHIKKVSYYIDKVNREIGGDAVLDIEDYKKYYNVPITIIGDSIAECAKHSLELYFPKLHLDSAGSRELSRGLKIYEEMKKNNEIGEVLVVSLGTNSTKKIDVDALSYIYDDLKGKPMIILTIIIPNLPVEIERNKTLIEFATTHKNCYIADWYSVMKTRSEYFQKDNTHPLGTGNHCFAQIIFKTMLRIINDIEDND